MTLSHSPPGIESVETEKPNFRVSKCLSTLLPQGVSGFCAARSPMHGGTGLSCQHRLTQEDYLAKHELISLTLYKFRFQSLPKVTGSRAVVHGC